jgi:F-type H+-transporting ATPase subunit delta
MAQVSSVYAKALFELGQEKKQLDQILAELKEFSDACRTSEALGSILAGSGFNPIDRKAVLAGVLAAMSLSGVSKKLLELLVARGRIGDLSQIVRELEAMIEGAQGIRAGGVRSAVELSVEELAHLGQALAKRVGGRVRLTQVVDPSLLGGVVATVGGKTFDASLRSQLERFKNELI